MSRRVSPSLVVAVLALVACASGVALAQPATESAVSKKKVKKIADKEIAKLAPGLSVANANTVGGIAPSGLVRSASASADNVLTGSAANGTVAQTTIEAPRSGHLQITASSDVFGGGTDAGIHCFISVDGQRIPASDRVLLNTGGVPTLDHFDNCATNVTVPVPAGTHSVGLEFTDVVSANVNERTLAVLFVAFGPNGE